MMEFDVSSKELLLKNGYGIIRIGTAPDGVGLLVVIRRPPDVRFILHQAGLAIGAENSFELKDSPLSTVAEILETLIKNRFVRNLPVTGESSREVIIIPKPLRAVIGPTLLEGIFSHNIPTIVERGFADTRANITGSDTKETDGGSFKFENGESYLAFDVHSDSLLVIKKELDSKQWHQYSFKRIFQRESVLAFPKAKYIGRRQTELADDIQFEVSQTDQYINQRTQKPEIWWELQISRSSIVKIILELCRKLSHYHQTKRIHGDLKPANILLIDGGVEIIDSLSLKPGDKSPALTRGWAAPEPVLRQPVNYQSDQYPIGLMLLNLVKGVLYGEERIVIIPIGGIETERHSLLQNTGVFIDPKVSNVYPNFIPTYQKLIAKCLQFNSQERFSSMEELISELQSLDQKDTLRGEIYLPLSFGTLGIGVNEGRQSLNWLTNKVYYPGINSRKLFDNPTVEVW